MSLNFIEQVFGASPDNGNGSLELEVLLAVAILVIVGLRRYAGSLNGASNAPGEAPEVQVAQLIVPMGD